MPHPTYLGEDAKVSQSCGINFEKHCELPWSNRLITLALVDVL